jgi:hypothetical protein
MSSCCDTLGQPAKSVSATYGCFKNAGICDLKSNIATITNLTTNNLTTNNITVINDPSSYATGRIAGPIPFGVEPVIVPITSASGPNYVDNNITDTGTGWVVTQAGNYVIQVGYTIVSIVPAGFGPGETIGGSSELLINGSVNGTIAFMQGNSVVATINQDNYAQSIFGELPVTLAVGDLIELQASSRLSGAGPTQIIIGGSYKIQRLGN